MGNRNHIQTIQSIQNKNHKHKPDSKILPLPIQNTTIQPMEVLQRNHERKHDIQRIRIHTLPSKPKHRTRKQLQTTNRKIHQHATQHQIKRRVRTLTPHQKHKPKTNYQTKTQHTKQDTISQLNKTHLKKNHPNPPNYFTIGASVGLESFIYENVSK